MPPLFPRDFFRQMPNALLARYFKARGVLQDFDFVTMKETRIDALSLPIEKRGHSHIIVGRQFDSSHSPFRMLATAMADDRTSSPALASVSSGWMTAGPP